MYGSKPTLATDRGAGVSREADQAKTTETTAIATYLPQDELSASRLAPLPQTTESIRVCYAMRHMASGYMLTCAVDVVL